MHVCACVASTCSPLTPCSPPSQLSLPPSLRLRAFTTGSNHGAIAVLLSTSEVLEKVQEQALSRDTKVVSFCVEVRHQATPKLCCSLLGVEND